VAVELSTGVVRARSSHTIARRVQCVCFHSTTIYVDLLRFVLFDHKATLIWLVEAHYTCLCCYHSDSTYSCDGVENAVSMRTSSESESEFFVTMMPRHQLPPLRGENGTLWQAEVHTCWYRSTSTLSSGNYNLRLRPSCRLKQVGPSVPCSSWQHGGSTLSLTRSIVG